VYGLAAASAVPILFGVLFKEKLPISVISTAAVMGLLIHLGLNLFGGVVNPAVSAAYAIILVTLFSLISLLFLGLKPTNS
jgi:SSS family solute:Na+ symporter/sodium/pantothenate symporter